MVQIRYRIYNLRVLEPERRERSPMSLFVSENGQTVVIQIQSRRSGIEGCNAFRKVNLVDYWTSMLDEDT